jgi:ubiquinone biosynthesis monooxygenase Coq7
MDVVSVKLACELPAHLAGEMRSNHAGETGAVWIYKGILTFSLDEEVCAFAKAHLKTEQQHLAFFDEWLTRRQKSLLLPVWRLSGFLLGVIAAVGGRTWVYASIEAVETFVVTHYESQFAALDLYGDAALSQQIHQFCADEGDHRNEATRAVTEKSRWLRAWCWLVGFGSAKAVRVARKL